METNDEIDRLLKLRAGFIGHRLEVAAGERSLNGVAASQRRETSNLY